MNNVIYRWLLLWKYGGIYLDTDVLVKEDLSNLGNFAGFESDKYVGAGVIGLTPRHELSMKALIKFAMEFDGTVWGAYGPELLTDVLESL